MKKTTLLFALASFICSGAGAAEPVSDSVYVKAFATTPSEGFHLAYSSDKKTWVTIGDNYNFFKSDFGTWGAEKKMYTPTLSFNGKVFHAEFIPNPNVPQLATTESKDMWLWSPQEYPVLSEADFNAKKEELKARTGKDIIRVPYSVVKNLLVNVEAAQFRAQQEAETMRDDKHRYNNLKSVNVRLDIDMNDRKSISPNLFGIFFEDINYAADGGLYAELIQNRDFEFTPNDNHGRNAKSCWKAENAEFDIATENPIHANNAHYAVIKSTTAGAKLIIEGWDGITLNANEKYDLSLFLRGEGGKVKVSLVDGGKTLASKTFSVQKSWKQYTGTITTTAAADKANLVIEVLQPGKVDVDFVSLFPVKTFKGRKNGLRNDLAQLLADIQPKFIRFPGGCMSHGQGINNIYHWQATVGELWERQPDFNIWNYHQTRGLGFYEYFQFCEDIGAEPLPVLAAGVPCQNSHKGGHGQQGGIPFEKDLNGKPSPYTYNGKPLTMESYLQELLDLIEWANGDAKTSKLAQMRAKAGHPKPFNLKYLGIGNEDLLGEVFMKRFDFLHDGVKKAHPEITIVGTVGPFWEGSDYEFGWEYARKKGVDIVDEHYYNPVGWYFNNQNFYDRYPRTGTKVYLGEWASKGNRLENALAEAIHITNVERNADVVTMSSYAPLLAKHGHTQWNPDMIYFDNKAAYPTVNYHIHSICGQNAGDEYIYANRTVSPVVEKDNNGRDMRTASHKDISKRIGSSVVTDSKTGDIIIKLVNALPVASEITIPMPENMEGYKDEAKVLTVSGNYDQKEVTPATSSIKMEKEIKHTLSPYSFTVIRIQKNTKK